MPGTTQDSPTAKQACPYSLFEESQLLLKLYADVGTANFWQGFMKHLAGVAKIHAGALALSRTDRWEVLGAWAWNLDLDSLGQYMTEEMAARDELMAYVSAAPPGCFYTSNMHLAATMNFREFGPIYNEWILPRGLDDVAAALMQEDDTAIFVGLYRLESQDDFSSEQLTQLNRLLPHIRRALRLHCELVQQQGVGDLQGWLSLIKVPVLLFDENFRCCDQNAAARVLLDSQSKMRLENGHLELSDPHATNQVGFQVMRTIKVALGQIAHDPKMLSFSLDGEPVNFIFMPVEDNSGLTVTSAGALVFIYQPSFRYQLDFSALQPLFGLTDAELAVCSQLAQGLSPQEIAEAQDKSRETVRTQLKAAYGKTGAGSQAELVMTFLTHPLVLGAT